MLSRVLRAEVLPGKDRVLSLEWERTEQLRASCEVISFIGVGDCWWYCELGGKEQLLSSARWLDLQWQWQDTHL